jgi:hypothetical protein
MKDNLLEIYYTTEVTHLPAGFGYKIPLSHITERGVGALSSYMYRVCTVLRNCTEKCNTKQVAAFTIIKVTKIPPNQVQKRNTTAVLHCHNPYVLCTSRIPNSLNIRC